MDGGRSLRGWLVTCTVATTLTLVLLAMERYLRQPSSAPGESPRLVESRGASTERRQLDPSADAGRVAVVGADPRATGREDRQSVV